MRPTPVLAGVSWLAGLCGLLDGWSAPVRAEAPVPATAPQGAILEANEENDWFTGTDRHYTQGFRLAYLGADDAMPRWLLAAARRAPAPGFDLQACRAGLEVGQNAYTPTDTATKEPVPDDRPYAGWSYAGAILQRRGLTSDQHLPVLENFRLQLGVVGPAALAEQLQNRIHVMGNFTYAQGWDHQLPNEPGLALKYQRAWRLAPAGQQDGWGVQFIPHAGASLGNVDTSARAGALVRLGWHLPDDFGIQTIDSLGIADGGRAGADHHRPWGVYLFGGAEGRAVAYDIFLDGDLFRDSPHVERQPWVGVLNGGAALTMGRMDVAIVFVYLTRQFQGQSAPDAYGSVFARWSF